MKRDIRSMKDGAPSSVGAGAEDSSEKLRRDVETYAGKSRDELLAEFAALSQGMDAARREALLKRVLPMLDSKQRSQAEALVKQTEGER